MLQICRIPYQISKLGVAPCVYVEQYLHELEDSSVFKYGRRFRLWQNAENVFM